MNTQTLTPEELSNEQWKRCPRFAKYEVSNLGRFRRKSTGHILTKRIHKRTGRLYLRLVPDEAIFIKYAKPTVSPAGHRHYGRSVRKFVSTAPLIARAFLGRRRGRQVDHLNGKLDERVCSLEYVTQSVNCKRAWDRGDQPRTKNAGGMTQADHDLIWQLHRGGMSQVRIGKTVGCNNGTVSRLLAGKISRPRYA